MTDLTSRLNELLIPSGVPPAGSPSPTQRLDKFLVEAHRINGHITRLHNELRDVRQAYLATGPPRRALRPRDTATAAATTTTTTTRPDHRLTDREREVIDVTAKRSIRELTAGIQQLEQAAEVMRTADEAVIRKKHGGRFGALAAWASGGGGGGGGGSNSSKSVDGVAATEAVRDVAAHRASVVAYLRHRLEACCRTQQGMMEKRLQREMEKNRSVLARAGGGGGAGTGMGMGTGTGAGAGPGAAAGQQYQRWSAPAKPPTSTAAGPGHEENDKGAAAAYAASQGLTAEQVQMFEQGNEEMMRQSQTELGKIRSAQESLVEIAQLQNTLVGNLSEQREQIGLLAEEQSMAEDNVRGGNRELARAGARASTARMTFMAAAGVSAFLVLWDLVV